MADHSNEQDEKKTKTKSFDGYLGARSEGLKALTKAVIAEIETLENRKRKRKKSDQAIFEVTIEAILCNVLLLEIVNPNKRVAVPMSHRRLSTKSRYRSPVLGSKFPDYLKLLSGPKMDLIELETGWKKAVDTFEETDVLEFDVKLSSIKATDKLLHRANAELLEFDDFCRIPGEEVIVLKAEKKWHGDRGEWTKYLDTPDTDRMREELEDINLWLDGVNLFAQAGDWLLDGSQKRLQRIFNNGSFKEGGRLFGGFWQNMHKANRRNDLEIDGQPIAELDYGQMFLRMLYADTASGAPDVEDLYIVPGYELHRKGVKTIITAALTTDTELLRMPEGARKHFSDDIPFSEVMAKIVKYHAPIARHFFTGVGMKLQKREADIMVKLLLKAKAQDLILLPIHDGVLCQSGREQETKRLMETVFREETGADAVVRIEHH